MTEKLSEVIFIVVFIAVAGLAFYAFIMHKCILFYWSSSNRAEAEEHLEREEEIEMQTIGRTYELQPEN